MNKLMKYLLILTLFVTVKANAVDGDTTNVVILEDGLWDWYGSIYGSANFDTDKTYRKVTFKYILGCPSGGCSDWDYSTAIYLRDDTGNLDSTLIDYPSFLTNGQAIDSVFISSNVTYNVAYDVSLINDSTVALYEVVGFNDVNNLELATDTNTYYQGNFWTFEFDSNGDVIDSLWNAATDTLILTHTSAYSYWEIVDEYEVARVITPYGGYWTSPREQVYEFDLTDYQHLLKDSVSFRAWYGGWSAGWNLNLEMELIEGTPARTCEEIVTLWDGDYKYGVTSQPISESVTPQNTFVPSNIEGVRLRSLLTGHSFGGNENCAEFCPKTHTFRINDEHNYDQFAWREDCGYNPVFPQNGTWVYNRAGWCPGLDVNWYEYELSDIFTPNDSLLVAYNFDTYTYDGTASFDPSYRIATYLYLYGGASFNLDAELMEIISPSHKTAHSRKNPICGSPEIKIRNSGSTELTSLTISYGVKGGEVQSYQWSGSLAFLEEEVVELNPLIDLSLLEESGSKFFVEISNPNGGTDEYDQNNSAESNFEMVPVLANDLVIWFRTNNAAWETTYQISDVNGNILYQNQSGLSAATLYKDSVSFETGCYHLEVFDTDGDGSSWWANNDGAGYVQIRASNGTPMIVESFTGDYGSGFQYEFTVGDYTNVEESVLNHFIDIFPNPSESGLFNMELMFSEPSNVKYDVYSVNGQLIKSIDLKSIQESRELLDLSNQSVGLYFVKIVSGDVVKTIPLMIN